MIEHENIIRYVAGVFLIALSAIVLGVVKRDSSRGVLREVLKNALYVYGGAIGLGGVAYLICLLT